eukprot:scaffold265870_cov30-Tisochrysis_lutea.AAC.3
MKQRLHSGGGRKASRPVERRSAGQSGDRAIDRGRWAGGGGARSLSNRLRSAEAESKLQREWRRDGVARDRRSEVDVRESSQRWHRCP